MNKLLKAGRFCHVIPASEVLFEVEDASKSYIANNKKPFVVNLEVTCVIVGYGKLMVYHAVMRCLVLLI